MKVVYNTIRNNTLLLILIVIGVISHSCFGLGMADYSRYVFDSISSNSVDIRNVIIIGFAVVSWGAVSLVIINMATDYLISRLIKDLRNECINKLVKLPLYFFEKNTEGKIITNYTQDINAVAGLVKSFISVIKTPFEMVIASAYLFYHNWMLALIIIILLPLVMIVGKYIGKTIQTVNKQYLLQNDEALKLLTRIYRGASIIKTYMLENYMTIKFKECTEKQLEYDEKKAKCNGIFSGFTDFFMGLPFIIVYMACASLFTVQEITVGTLTMFLQLLNKITVPFVSYSRILMQYKEARVSVERLDEIFENKEKSASLNQNFGDIVFHNVNFSYEQNTVLKNINVKIEKGKYYGIIGDNGSGKSTFIKLLMQLYQPQLGDISYLPLQNTANKIVYVEDKPGILFDNIGNNIAVEIEFNDTEIKEVLQHTGLHEDVIEKILFNKTTELSAGQLQRISLARGLYHLKENDVFILDEAFASLDVSSIPKIQERIQDYRKKMNLTVLEITHNMDNMDRFDEILFFRKGEIILQGKNEQLKSSDTYISFVNALKSNNISR